MPEGDTILHAALRMRPVLEGRVPDAIETPHPRHGLDRWPQRLAGRPVSAIRTHGKHLFICFGAGADAGPAADPAAEPDGVPALARAPEGAALGETELLLHSHLRMSGSWGVYANGRPWRRARRRAWLIIRCAGHEIVQFDGPVLELLSAGRARFEQRLAGLGPDILADEFEPEGFLRRLREDDPTRPIGDALLDQRTIAGIGNIWKAEGCWEAAVDPWRATGEVSDAEAVAIVMAARPRMLASARGPGYDRHPRVYGRVGMPCPRCGERIRARGQGEQNRTTYWCPGCQR